jgi:hypothetical protein
MPRRVTIKDLTGLSAQHANFVVEYTKDFATRRAAEASGFAPDTGYQLLQREDVQSAIGRVLEQRLDAAVIDAEWVLMEAVDNHMIARQRGNINASNTALNLIAKHVFVDAFAAEKVEVASDKEVMERLLRARKRVTDTESPPPDDTSFL